MTFLPLLGDYIAWHYTRAFRDMYVAWGNMLFAVLNFFSVPLLLRTFFSPWKRMEDTPREGDVEDFFSTLLVNLLSRFVGAFIRFWLVITGLLVSLGMLIGVVLVTVIWLLAPFIGIGSIVYGTVILF